MASTVYPKRSNSCSTDRSLVLVAVQGSTDILDDSNPRPDAVDGIKEYGKAIALNTLPALIPELAERLTWRPSSNDFRRIIRYANLQEHADGNHRLKFAESGIDWSFLHFVSDRSKTLHFEPERKSSATSEQIEHHIRRLMAHVAWGASREAKSASRRFPSGRNPSVACLASGRPSQTSDRTKVPGESCSTGV